MTAPNDSSLSPFAQTDKSPDAHKIGRWQFSLRGLMLFILLVMMGLALCTTAVRLRRAETELDEYRREYGILKVDNPAMLYAVARWTPEPDQWRWQVHFPPGRYDVCAVMGGIEEYRIPKNCRTLTADFNGDQKVSVVLFQADSKGGPLKCRIEAGPWSSVVEVPNSLKNPPVWSDGGIQWKDAPTIVAPDEPVVLLRRRIGVRQKNGSTTLGLGPSDGLMLWIRRVGEPTGVGVILH